MRFQVPQFIEVESKIFGPLTLKQFIFLAGGAGIVFIIYALTNSLFLAALLSSPFAAISLALAFYKMNNQPFIKTMENAFNYFVSSKIYVWKKMPEQKTVLKSAEKKQETSQEIYVPKLTESKLKDLSWSLNIKEKIK
ncbi:PrgI family protein [Patescibacteria group bacterium]|nr:PrgI family protein [Patescibacteria group bacterium]